MPSTPPPSMEDISCRDGVITPATPRYGPMFDPDCYTIIKRRKASNKSNDIKAKKKISATNETGQSISEAQKGNSRQVLVLQDDELRQAHDKKKLDIEDKKDDSNSAAEEPEGRSRTRTRTISGAVPGIQMLTPRETPQTRRSKNLDDSMFDTDLLSQSGIRSSNVQRVLFPQASDKLRMGQFVFPEPDGSSRRYSSNGSKIQVYREISDSEEDQESNVPVLSTPSYSDNEDPFVSNSERYSKQPRSKCASESLQSAPSKKGMMFVFRGKRIFRPFPQEEDANSELSIGSIKPRVLFPQITSSKHQGAIGSSSSSTALSSDSSQGSFRTTDRYKGVRDMHRRLQKMSDLGEDPSNIEEEETDIENYNSP
ncbi:hypothetical protein V1511DRAFT_496657 [Dipodascopsis uninucleata]